MILKPITIVGGGLAGLTLGIALRQRDVPVTLHEAGRYPRHRVCGEFISGHGQQVLRDLGLEKKIYEAGAIEAKTAAFFTTKISGKNFQLPSPALCLSRYHLDHLLAKEFVRLGGELREQSRYQENFTDGIIRATGRRTQAKEDGWRWFGLKVHARNVTLMADLEIHLQPQGYVGLCQLNGGETNICGLFRSRQPVPDLAQTWRDWLQGVPGSELHSRLAKSDFITDTFCSISGLSLSPQLAISHEECSIGDAITMIAPVTGNGMSMAFESAHLATGPMADYSAGKITWQEAWESVTRHCDQHFSRRLRWSARLQKLMFHPGLAGGLIRIGSSCPTLWNRLIAQTR